jgi:hypothetical protein
LVDGLPTLWSARMTLISNEYRTCSLSDPAIADAVNEAKGYALDPAEMLIAFEDRAAKLWRIQKPSESRESFIDSFIASAIDNL